MRDLCIEVVFNFVELFVIVIFIKNYFNSEKHIDLRLMTAIFGLSVLNFCFSKYFNFEFVEGLWVIGQIFLLTLVFNKKPIRINIILCTIITATIIAINAVCLILTKNWLGMDYGDTMQGVNKERIMLIVISKMMLFFVLYIFSLYNKYKKQVLSLTETIIYTLTVISIIFAAILLIRMSIYYDFDTIYNTLLTLAIILLFIVNFSSNYIFNKNLEKALKEQKLQQEIDNAKNIAHNMEESYTNIRTVKHDLKNHLEYIRLNINNDKKILDYIDKIINTVNKSYDFVDLKKTELSNLINLKLYNAAQNGIRVSVVTQNEDVLENVPVYEMVIALGNLLDNAIEHSIKEDDKEIFVDVYRHKSFVCVEIKNRIGKSVLKDNAQLKTGKMEDGHGYGMQSARKAIQSIGGAISVYEKSHWFCAKIVVPNMQKVAS